MFRSTSPAATTADATLRVSQQQREKRRVALRSILAATGTTALKAVVGFRTGSLGILSEAAHSALDLMASVITFVSVRVSDKPADAEHQYGHQKIENFSAFLQTALLLLTCVWIVVEAVRRLLHRQVEIEPSVWAFGVMFLSMAVDYNRARALRRTARKYDSQALEADALHFSTDVWSSLVVIFGLTLVWAGRHYGIPELAVADPLAAVGVSGIVAYIGLQLGKRTVDALLDAAPRGVRAALVARVRQVEGVLGCERLRVRRAGNRYFVDTIIAVERSLPFEQVKAISDAVEERIHQTLPQSDVMIHTEPRPPHHGSLFEKVKAVAARHNLFVHELAAHDVAGKRHLELHLEVSDRLTLRQAHELVTRVGGRDSCAKPQRLPSSTPTSRTKGHRWSSGACSWRITAASNSVCGKSPPNSPKFWIVTKFWSPRCATASTFPATATMDGQPAHCPGARTHRRPGDAIQARTAGRVSPYHPQRAGQRTLSSALACRIPQPGGEGRLSLRLPGRRAVHLDCRRKGFARGYLVGPDCNWPGRADFSPQVFSLGHYPFPSLRVRCVPRRAGLRGDSLARPHGWPPKPSSPACSPTRKPAPCRRWATSTTCRSTWTRR